MAGYIELTQPHEDVSIELESVVVEIATKTKPQGLYLFYVLCASF